MTLKQLRFLHEIARRSLNISNAAAALYTSQPGVSRQIQLLERELGVDLLLRRRNRILAVTDTGRAVLEVAQRLLNEAENIRRIADDARSAAGGRLALATSHLHARYTLLGPLREFSKRFPDVQLHVRQADADDIPKLVEANEVDLGISTEIARQDSRLATLPGGTVRRSVIVPKGHPLTRRKSRLTLQDIARYPVIGFHARSRAGQILERALQEQGIAVRYVVSANDSDVVKAYVSEGLGIAVVPELALDPRTDAGLHALDVTHLFPESFMIISLRRDAYLRRYLTDFIQMVVPGLTRDAIQKTLTAGGAGR